MPLGRWILEESLKVAKKWHKIISNFKMSVNLSYEQLKDLNFRDFVVDSLKRHGLPPSTLILELTESKIVTDWTFVNQQFDDFRRQGIKIAIDDFGTGNSSLSSMKYMSCDFVKIDRAFVENVLNSEFDYKLIKYTIMLCHSIGMKVCLEGVENFTEYELLKNQCNVDVIQGYLFGRPEPASTFEEKFLAPYLEELAEHKVVVNQCPVQYEISLASEC